MYMPLDIGRISHHMIPFRIEFVCQGTWKGRVPLMENCPIAVPLLVHPRESCRKERSDSGYETRTKMRFYVLSHSFLGAIRLMMKTRNSTLEKKDQLQKV